MRLDDRRCEGDGEGLRLDTARTVRGDVGTVINAVRALPDVDVKGGDLTVPLDAFAELYRAQGVNLDPTPHR